TYFYVVSAAYTGNPNSGGESADSSEANATPQGGPPAAPTNLTAKGTKPGSIDLRWVQSTTSGVTKNGVYRRLMNGGSYPSSPTVTINASTSYRDSGVAGTTSYCYVVTAISPSGESTRSTEACATTK